MSAGHPRIVLSLLAVGLAGALLVPAGPTSAAAPAAAPDEYVALGDSYSSGTGTRTYVDDGTACLRSPRAYPSLLAGRRGWELNFRACSGAEIDDVTRAQLGALSPATRHVTISVGGNDAGFADVLTTCARPWWFGSCDRAIDRARAFIKGALPAQLRALYSQIRSAAPNARVVVAGYPRIFGGRDCNPLTFFSGREMDRLNAAANLINRRTRWAASSRGFAFANPTRRFVGHAVCADAEWINGLSLPIVESFHPNRPGHRSGYLPAVGYRLPALAGRPAGGARDRVPAGEIATEQRRYARLDAGIRPQRVRAPDLTTQRARRAARRAGVDIDRWIARQRR